MVLKYWREQFLLWQSSSTWQTIPNKINVVIIKYSPISVILLWSSHSTNRFLRQKKWLGYGLSNEYLIVWKFLRNKKSNYIEQKEKNKCSLYIRRSKYCKKLLLGNPCWQLLQTKSRFIWTCILRSQKVFVSNVRRTVFINIQPRKCHL